VEEIIDKVCAITFRAVALVRHRDSPRKPSSRVKPEYIKLYQRCPVLFADT
jgi:hypothetical protein